MKQKKLEDILYVFDVTPYEITQDTDATTIKVQEECVAGFKELNASLADKIVAYNYHTMVAQVPVWAPYVDEPDQTPQKLYVMNVDEDYGFYGTYTLIVNDGAPAAGTFETSVTSGDTIKLYFGNITKAQFEEQVVMTKCELNHGASTFEPTLKSDDEHYYYEFIMPAGTLGFFFRINRYNFEVYGQSLEGKVSNLIDGTEIFSDTASGLHKGQAVKIVPVDDPSYYTLVSGNVSWDSDQGAWTGTIGGENLAVEINYTAPAQAKLTVTYTGETPDFGWPNINGKGGWVSPTIISGDDRIPQQGDVYEYTLDPGDEFEFDERNMYSDKSITFSPELSQGTGEGLWGVGQAYVMANTNVTATVFTGTAPDNNEQPE